MSPNRIVSLHMADSRLLLKGGKVWDGTHQPTISSLLIEGSRILSTGTDDQLSARVGPETQIIDLKGRRVIPGLIDSHIHMVRAGLRWSEIVRWNEVQSLGDALELIRDAASTRPSGQWIAVLGGWHPGQFAEGRSPTKAELDDAGEGHPVYVQRSYVEGHLNTSALAAVTFSEGAVVDHATGHVVGQLALGACNAQLGMPDLETQISGTREMIDEFHRLGLTGAIDTAGFGMTPELYEASSQVQKSGGHPFRHRMLVGPGSPGNEIDQIERWSTILDASSDDGSEDDFFRYLGFGEVFLFGAHDMEGLVPKDITGQIDGLAAIFEQIARADWPIHVHAILDESVSATLDAWDQVVGQGVAPVTGSAIAHAEGVSERDLERIRSLGLGLTIQNGMAFRGQDSVPSWGAERVSQSPPLRTILEFGIPVAAGTDGSVASSYNPWVSLAWMVNGAPVHSGPWLDASQLLTRDEALTLYTSGSAWFSGEDADRGILSPGSLADIAVLSDDFLTTGEDRLSSITSDLTIVDGKVVFAAPDLLAL